MNEICNQCKDRDTSYYDEPCNRCFHGVRETKTEREEKQMKECTNNGWIPCSKKLPERECLMCDTCGNIMIGTIYEDIASATDYMGEHEYGCMFDVIAWMPLPDPYREDDE